jgi:polysaccharide biosynthesis transport protein
MDRAFRTSAQVETALQMECLALIPKVQNEPRSESSSRQQLKLIVDSKNQRIIGPASDALRHLIEAPFSRFAESIRAMKMAADLRGPGKSKVIGLTSSVPGEGKSTLATALAMLIAQAGGHVSLVDCDLRNPALSRLLTPKADAGIVEIIAADQRLEKTVWKDPATDMTFLPAVNVSNLGNTSDILAGDAMKRLFDVLRMQYDYVIVDLSPLAPVVDVRATTRLLDFYIFVVEWGHTRIDVVQQALKESHGVYDNMLGVVLNKVDVKLMAGYEGNRAQYYRKYFAQYGYTD